MNIFGKTKSSIAQSFANDYTVASLRLLVIAWAVFVVVLALIVKNPVLLATILAWEVLP